MAGSQFTLAEGRTLAIHMVGICGVGMAGLALLLKDRGHMVTGCDLAENRLYGWLQRVGISAVIGHDAEHITDDIELVIRSRAVSDDCVDILRATSMNIPVVYRGEVLPQLIKEHVSVAVSGTHGKTTTSSFIAQILQDAGEDPSWCIGAECPALSGVGYSARKRSEPSAMIVEADESDGTVALYEPDIALVTNIEFDHMEYFRDEDAFRECFRTFAQNAGQRVIYCADDANCCNVTGDIDAVSYGFGESCDFRAVSVQYDGAGQRFTVEHHGTSLGELYLCVPGRHNVLNALAACVVCIEMGLSFDAVKEGLGKAVLPVRRFDRVVQRDGVVVISDYAHHPSEIRSLIDTAKRLPHKRILGVFQPHRYTRTLALGSDFVPALSGLDELILCPVYAASEAPLRGGRTCDLYERFRSVRSDLDVKLAGSLSQAWAYLRKELREGDILLVIGAGDVDDIARWAAENGWPWPVLAGIRDIPLLQSSVVRFDEPLSDKTTMGVGGRADIWAEIGCMGDLMSLYKWALSRSLDFRLIGAGSNLLVSDMGVRGVTARLAGDEFKNIRIVSSVENRIAVGAAVSVPKLLGWLSRNGFTGLEFLEGIPGRVGGLVWMNAGAYDKEIGERVIRIRCLNQEGDEFTFERKELEWGYRTCPTLREMIILEAEFSLDRGDLPEAEGFRREIAGKRVWMKGLRSAGSVFKNHVGSSDMAAGALIEKAGVKGKSVGHARVYEGHGNFIVTEKGATASDVEALAQLVQAEVKKRCGVELKREMISLG